MKTTTVFTPFCLFCAALAICCLPAICAADDVFEECKSRNIERVLRLLKSEDEIDSYAISDTVGVYTCKIDGLNFIIHNQKKKIILRAYFPGEDISLRKVNRWNKEKNTRVFIDSDNDLALAAEILVQGGITEERLFLSIAAFANSVGSCKEFFSE